MRSIPVQKGQKIMFVYDEPKTGPAQRHGTIQYVRRADKTKSKLIVFNIYDEAVGGYRSFHFNKMHNIIVGV